uniref:Uncharacterized protein n=2 Tax=Picea TaxID=3328 RepID=A0A101M0Y9_PICGL|nr:hypothetical protein ABT39_MTgene4361 [Picea glauca]QHR91797.1 hypothetical protein Q903MT_gene5833 [Picea sitchensis]
MCKPSRCTLDLPMNPSVIGKQLQTWAVGIVFDLISHIRIDLLPELNMSAYLFSMSVPCFACMLVDVSPSLLLDLRASIPGLPSLFSFSVSGFINHNHLWLIVFYLWEQGTGK